MKSIIKYAENILQYGRDRYRRNPSPLFADGLNIFTGEHLFWKTPGESKAVVSNLACQQNLFRLLVALSRLTGDSKFRDAAEAAIQYHFDHLMDSSGLLQWGGHRFIDLVTLEARGTGMADMAHELKNTLPFYDLMFKVDSIAAARYIEAFWNAHLHDWDELYMSRHGQYGLKSNDVWQHELVQKDTFRESPGLSFLNTGNDLIYAAAQFYKHTGNEAALRWAKHLAFQYVLARHPETGLGAYQFTQPLKRMETNDDNLTLSYYGDRAKRQFGSEFGDIALEANVLFDDKALNIRTIYCLSPLLQLQIAAEIGEAANCFREWVHQGMLNFAKYAYVPETNEIKPMFSDGRDLTGTVFHRNGFYGKAGSILKRWQADGGFLLSYARCFLHTGDERLWNVVRSIGNGIGLGDLGSIPGENTQLNLDTKCTDARVLFAIVELFRATSNNVYLDLGKRVGRNIESTCFHHGYFTKGPNYIFTSFDAIEPLALIALEEAVRQEFDIVPVFLGGKGFIHGNYQFPERIMQGITGDYLYNLRIDKN